MLKITRSRPGYPSLKTLPVGDITRPRIILKGDGICLKGRDGALLHLSGADLSLHVALIGGSGMGKTHALKQITEGIRRQMHERDLMVIFDVKGDFLRDFGEIGDPVISSDERARGGYWNLLKEAAADGPGRHEDNAREIALSVFDKAIKKSSSPYFPQAAAELFMALIFTQLGELSLGLPRNNRTLYELCTADSEAMLAVLDDWPEVQAAGRHIERDNDQTAGVLSELKLGVGSVFSGNFRQEGDLSLRMQLRQPQRQMVFIEYDIGMGRVLAPIYSLLFDMAIKETLRGQAGGVVYLVMDEFRLLPHLNHLEDATSQGREMGLRMLIAAQNIGQIRHAYGTDLADSMIASFGTKIVFNNHDYATRLFLSQSFGTVKRINELQGSREQGLQRVLTDSFVVTDEDIRSLQIGETFIKTSAKPPGRFAFSAACARR